MFIVDSSDKIQIKPVTLGATMAPRPKFSMDSTPRTESFRTPRTIYMKGRPYRSRKISNHL